MPDVSSTELGHQTAVRWSQEASADCAARLHIPLEAAQLFAASEVIDLHIDSFIWTRIAGYDLGREHSPGPLNARFFRQVDLPRLRRVGVSGATWVITTNPLRSSRARAETFYRNLERLKSLLEGHRSDVALVRTEKDYWRAREEGKHAAFIGIQGGSALDFGLEQFDRAAPDVLRITLLHLYSSKLGRTSTPATLAGPGLSPFGKDVVRALNARRIFVDLAHIDRQGFFDALDVHDPTLPPIVTHSGVSGAYPSWRNLDDAQLRALADRGGIVGILYHGPFLAPGLARCRADAVVEHIDHVVQTVGEDHVALGSDWDGAITTPQDMPTCLELPRLVALLLSRGYSEDRIRKILGLNFLRVLKQLRG